MNDERGMMNEEKDRQPERNGFANGNAEPRRVNQSEGEAVNPKSEVRNSKFSK